MGSSNWAFVRSAGLLGPHPPYRASIRVNGLKGPEKKPQQLGGVTIGPGPMARLDIDPALGSSSSIHQTDCERALSPPPAGDLRGAAGRLRLRQQFSLLLSLSQTLPRDNRVLLLPL